MAALVRHPKIDHETNTARKSFEIPDISLATHGFGAQLADCFSSGENRAKVFKFYFQPEAGSGASYDVEGSSVYGIILPPGVKFSEEYRMGAARVGMSFLQKKETLLLVGEQIFEIKPGQEEAVRTGDSFVSLLKSGALNWVNMNDRYDGVQGARPEKICNYLKSLQQSVMPSCPVNEHNPSGKLKTHLKGFFERCGLG